MPMNIVYGEGPKDARVVVVGEAPGAEEDATGRPFIGTSGVELDKMLQEAGINRADCYVTNVFKERPANNDVEVFLRDKRPRTQGEGQDTWSHVDGKWLSSRGLFWYTFLLKEIGELKPTVIIALGNTALWALTGLSGITDWRGSILSLWPKKYPNGGSPFVLPTYHPAAILRMWEWRWIAVQDLRRAKRILDNPDNYNNWSPPPFTIRPSFSRITTALETTINYLNNKETNEFICTIDLETKYHKLIACIGLNLLTSEGDESSIFCIPFMTVNEPYSYWSTDEEFILITLLRELLTHPRCNVVGQNLIYDCQYIARWWGFIPNVKFDTMLAHHVCFAGMPKSLDFLASMYLDHYCFWKEEGKEWTTGMGEDEFWGYNCKDVYYTGQVRIAINSTIERLGLREVWAFQLSLFRPVLKMMLRGIRVDEMKRAAFAFELAEATRERQQYINNAIGRELNVKSPKQLAEFFYDEMGARPIINRKTGAVTCNEDALKVVGVRDPVLRPICERINEIRSLGVYLSTFVQAQTDPIDKRLRCSYNIAGTTTFRFSSSKDAFGSGLNLQNIPAEDKEAKEKAKKGKFIMPNVRKLFKPDPGYIVIDADLDRADLQVVVWEADDDDLRQKLREGIDLHAANASDLFGAALPAVSYFQRQMAKVFVHGTNYGGSARTMAQHCAITVHEADTMQKRWFAAHPGIKKWHRRVEQLLQSQRFVTNGFGYRRFFFERIEGILPEALAWIPQSTVACVINRGLVNLDTYYPIAEILLQVHDSLTFQIPRSHYPNLLPLIEKELLIPIPYPKPLIIPIGFKASEISWGDCEEVCHHCGRPEKECVCKTVVV